MTADENRAELRRSACEDRDPTGCINWQCARCGRWATPVPLEVEAAAVGEKLRITRLIRPTDGGIPHTKGD